MPAWCSVYGRQAVKVHSPSTLVEQALEYSKAGWWIYPCIAGQKAPLIKGGLNAASSDPVQVLEWFTRWPTANLAVATGPSNLVVIDEDVKNGVDGMASLKLLEAATAFAETLSSHTPSGGRHFFFRAPAGSVPRAIGLLPGIDVLAGGSSAVLPPSRIRDACYSWADTAHEPLPLPDDLRELLIRFYEASRRRRSAGKDGPASEGNRNNHLFRRACSLTARGFPQDRIANIVHRENLALNSPLDAAETDACARSAARYRRGYECTDIGNARRLVDASNNDLRFVGAENSWLGRRKSTWYPLSAQEMMMRAVEVVADMREEAEQASGDDHRRRLERHADQSSSASKLRAMISVAEADPRIATDADEVNADPYLVGTPSGVIDLRKGAHVEAEDNIISRRIAADLIPGAECPVFLEFMNTIFRNDHDLINFAQRAFGYALSGLTGEQVMFFMHGRGANGKSTLLQVLSEIMGDYAMTSPSTAFMAGDRPDHVALARLPGVRMVIGTEPEHGTRLSEALLKQITGGDTVAARPLYRNYFEFIPQFKLVIATNFLPHVAGNNEAIWRRICVIPFSVTIPQNKRDPRMAERLLAERSGILNWLLAGFKCYQDERLKPASAITEAFDSYRHAMDPLGRFIEEFCLVDAKLAAPAGALVEAYRNWASQALGEAPAARCISAGLVVRGFNRRRRATGIFYEGIQLRT